MKNVIKMFSIIALAVIIGFGVVTCGGDDDNNGDKDNTYPTNGRLTISGLAAHEGKYVYAEDSGKGFFACQSANTNNGGTWILGQISNGTVTLNVWLEGMENYNRSETANIKIYIFTSQSQTFSTLQNPHASSSLVSVTFASGVGSVNASTAFSGSGNSSDFIYADLFSDGNLAITGYTGSGGSVTIPASIEGKPVTSIATLSLLSNPTSLTSITSITLPDSVTSLTGLSFSGCTSLTAINIGAGNSAYSSQDGIAYNKAGNQIIRYPEGKTGSTFAIPSGILTIGSSAFENCINLNSITITSGVSVILREAFNGCTGLTSITIPSTVYGIETNAFSKCTGLVSVTFATGSNIGDNAIANNAFPEGSSGTGGNSLKTAYQTGKAGTYTRTSGGSTWAK